MAKKIFSYVIALIVIPALIIAGAVVFKSRIYLWLSVCVTVLACIPFFLVFEKGKRDIKEMITIAVMIALSVISRFIFAPLQSFKPVTAMVIITGANLGSEAGFMTGALTAVISNFYFGQGPWTPFQMFVWGLIGLLAGILSNLFAKSKWWLLLYGAVSGVIFSMLMDIWTVISQDSSFNFTRYKAVLITSVSFMAIYSISNVIFLLLLAKPIGSKIQRIQQKYGIS